jgi:hypothetical protein
VGLIESFKVLFAAPMSEIIRGNKTMKKLPELIALSIGMGVLSLVGAIAWQSVEPEVSPLAETAPAKAEPLQAGVIATGR